LQFCLDVLYYACWRGQCDSRKGGPERQVVILTSRWWHSRRIEGGDWAGNKVRRARMEGLIAFSVSVSWRVWLPDQPTERPGRRGCCNLIAHKADLCYTV